MARARSKKGPPPLFDVEAFASSLRGKQGPRRGYLFVGPPRTEYLHRLAVGALKAHYGAERFEVHFGPRQKSDPPLPLDSLLAELVSPGLFSEPKLVAIYDARSVLDQLPLLERTLRGSGEGTLALSIATKGTRLPDKVSKLFGKHGEVVRTREFYASPPPWAPDRKDDTELVKWVVLRAKQRGKRLDARLAAELVELKGAELAELDMELEKLSVLAGDRPQIDRATLAALVGASRGYLGFELADPLLSRDGAAALATVRRAILAEPDATGLLLTLLGTLRNKLDREMLPALELCDRERRRVSAKELNERLGVGLFIANRIAERLPMYRSSDEALAMRHAVYRAESDLKNGRAEPDWLLERLVLAFASPRPSRRR